MSLKRKRAGSRDAAFGKKRVRKQSEIPGAIHIFYFDKVTVMHVVQGHVYGLRDSIWPPAWIAIAIGVSGLDVTWPALTKTRSRLAVDAVCYGHNLFLFPTSLSFRVLIVQHLPLEILHLDFHHSATLPAIYLAHSIKSRQTFVFRSHSFHAVARSRKIKQAVTLIDAMTPAVEDE